MSVRTRGSLRTTVGVGSAWSRGQGDKGVSWLGGVVAAEPQPIDAMRDGGPIRPGISIIQEK